MSSTLERKCVGDACQIKDAAQGEITAVVATLGIVDRDGDVLLPGSLPPVSKVKISGYAHDVVMDGAAPAGMGSISPEGDKAVLRGRYFMSTTRGLDAFNTVKELGDEGEFSFGFPRNVTTAPMTEAWRAKGARRLIAGIVPIEASAVFRGAGIGTRLLSAKCDGCGGSRACGCAGHKLSVEEIFRRGKAIAATVARSAPTPTWAELSRQVAVIDGKQARFEAELTPVSETKRATARAWADAVARYWGVASPRIRWGVSSMKTLGEFDPREPTTIRVSPRVAMKDIGHVITHETSHYARFQLGAPYSDERGVEADTEYLLERLA